MQKHLQRVTIRAILAVEIALRLVPERNHPKINGSHV